MYMFLILILLSFKRVLLSEGLACQEVHESITFVQTCPHDANEWILAAEKKNCSHTSKDCTEELVYHCVPNHFENATLEVCAPVKYIVFGHCAEYSFLGRKVQANHNTNCKTCPPFYKSNEAYKYQECYGTSESTTIMATTAYEKDITRNKEENMTIQDSNQENDGIDEDTDRVLRLYIGLSIVFIIVFIAGLGMKILLCKKRKKKNDEEDVIEEEEKHLLGNMQNAEGSSSFEDQSSEFKVPQKAHTMNKVNGSIDAHPEMNVVRDMGYSKTLIISLKAHRTFLSKEEYELEEITHSNKIKSQETILAESMIINVYDHSAQDANQFKNTILLLIFGIVENADIDLHSELLRSANKFTEKIMALGCLPEVKMHYREGTFKSGIKRGQRAVVLYPSLKQNMAQAIEGYTKNEKAPNLIDKYLSNFMIFNCLVLEHTSDSFNGLVILGRPEMSLKLLQNTMEVSHIGQRPFHLMRANEDTNNEKKLENRNKNSVERILCEC